MPHHQRLRVRQVSLLVITALATSIFFLSAASAGAHVRPSLEATVGEETATGPIQEPTTETPTGESSPEPPTGASSPETRREERRKRREERRAQHRERRSSRSLAAETGCSMTLQATPTLITAGAPLSLAGTLSCPEASSVADQTVTLDQMIARSGDFYIAATTTTEADGTFQFAPTDLAVNSTFYVSADGAQSESTSVKVAPQVTIDTPLAGSELFAGSVRARRADAGADDADAVTFTGTVTPANAGTRVALQREDGDGAWSRIGGGEVNAEGQYSITHTFYRPGRANIRVVVRSHGLAMTTVSTPVTYQISRRRNRLLTIQASTDPITYGTALTITGTVPGALDAPVKLLAQTGDGPFVEVAETLTNGDEYSFSQSPLQSTRYRVTSATASSAILAEGIAYALTFSPPAPAVQAGAQLTFTGTLAPLHEGQAVELEGLNGSGIGYHVISTGTVSSTSTFSIAHTFSTVGTAMLRIYVPGDGEFQSAASEPFKVEVTPTP
jgi:hypothetical protein